MVAYWFCVCKTPYHQSKPTYSRYPFLLIVQSFITSPKATSESSVPSVATSAVTSQKTKKCSFPSTKELEKDSQPANRLYPNEFLTHPKSEGKWCKKVRQPECSGKASLSLTFGFDTCVLFGPYNRQLAKE